MIRSQKALNCFALVPEPRSLVRWIKHWNQFTQSRPTKSKRGRKIIVVRLFQLFFAGKGRSKLLCPSISTADHDTIANTTLPHHHLFSAFFDESNNEKFALCLTPRGRSVVFRGNTPARGIRSRRKRAGKLETFRLKRRAEIRSQEYFISVEIVGEFSILLSFFIEKNCVTV